MPAQSRRKRAVLSSDSEGPAVSLDADPADPGKTPPDADNGTDAGSESKVVLSQKQKRRKLDAQPAPQVFGKSFVYRYGEIVPSTATFCSRSG